MEIGEYYEIAKESTSQEIKQAVENMVSGGVPPANMQSIITQIGDKKVKIKFTEPADTVINGQLICTVKGVKIVMKAGSAPTDENDGTVVLFTEDGNTNYPLGKYSDTWGEVTGLTNDVVYYFRAFPYSDYGLYNRNKANIVQATPKAYLLYGFKINKSDSNQATRITYTEMAAGMTPAYMDFTNGAFNYGDWGNVWFVAENKPYMVKYDGTIDYELSANDYSKKADGVTASDVANSSYGGNAMAYFPLVWFKRWEENGYEYVNVCNIQLDETYKAYAHTRANGTVAAYKMLSIFEGSYISSKIRSLSGQAVGNSQTAATEITYATSNGSLWYTQSWSEIAMVADLLKLISRSDNAQTAFGYGRGGATAAINTGQLNTKGRFFGYSEAQSTVNCVKVFHIENFWGNVWNRIAGLINNAGNIYVKPYPAYNTTGSGYTNTALVPAGTNGGYVNLTKMTEYGRIPYNAAGSATTYACDGFWFNNAQVNYALFGGSWDNAALLGFSCVSLSNAAGTSVGACLSCEQPAA